MTLFFYFAYPLIVPLFTVLQSPFLSISSLRRNWNQPFLRFWTLPNICAKPKMVSNRDVSPQGKGLYLEVMRMKI
jgi:hypothetical protein